MRMDYYQLLDVEPTATDAELKAAYYRLAKKYHPDHNQNSPEAEERFKLVSEAYRTLGDKEKRLGYDAWLERHRAYRNAPEMAEMVGRSPIHMPGELNSMPRRTRVSARHAYERQEEREERRGRSRREKEYRPRYVPRIFLPRKNSKPGILHMLVVYGMALCLILPALVRGCSPRKPGGADGQPRLQPGESRLGAEACNAALEANKQAVYQQALAGDPDAQCTYGIMLINGYNGLEQDLPGGIAWLRRAADQGCEKAARVLRNLEAVLAEHPEALTPKQSPPEPAGDTDKMKGQPGSIGL